jgi:hypothetical protein
MPMREDCVHFESRTYASGEAARFCTLGLAPEAPWRCPDNCSRYELSGINVATDAGPLARPPLEDEPDDTPDNIEGVLADAETIVEEAEPDALREIDETTRKRRWWPFMKRPPDDGDTVRLSNR